MATRRDDIELNNQLKIHADGIMDHNDEHYDAIIARAYYFLLLSIVIGSI